MRSNAHGCVHSADHAQGAMPFLEGLRIQQLNYSIKQGTFANKAVMIRVRYSAHAIIEGKSMAQNSSPRIDESALTKGQRRKLNALRKSVGDEVGERAFAEWLASRPVAKADENAALIVDTLWPLVQQGTLAIPRGGYLLRRGRGRIIVEPAKQ